MKIFQKNHGKKSFIFLLIFLLLITFFSIYKLFIYMTPERMASFPGSAQSEETCESEIPDCQVCYLLNLDGMKGLGHSALLLIDETGAGQLFSYNGMQYGLLPCLLGKEGIGKMKVISMTPEETAVFLETGEPPASAFSTNEFDECRDFDRILYRYITRNEFDTILSDTKGYIAAGDEFEKLYAAFHAPGNSESGRLSAESSMEAFLSQEQLPKYQIYTHNCDTAARRLIALIDPKAAAFNDTEAGLFPKSNYKRMCRSLSEAWGFGPLGKDTWLEKLLQ